MTGTSLKTIAMQAEVAADGEPCSPEIDNTAALPAPGLFLLSSYKRETEQAYGSRDRCRGGESRSQQGLSQAEDPDPWECWKDPRGCWKELEGSQCSLCILPLSWFSFKNRRFGQKPQGCRDRAVAVG
uniref:Uncharacterized protein n=1 Tax=Mus musculus TaxID=10090 RepID=Q3UF37_MOUSE|nr:unnamed protein product [Mus musculus]